MRIQKYLSEQGVCSRREAEALIKRGLVSVNGKVMREMGIQIDPTKDRVAVSPFAQKEMQKKVTVVVNKPRGVASSRIRTEGKTIYDLLPQFNELYIIGRLDKASEGLLMLSNDGVIARTITGDQHRRLFFDPVFGCKCKISATNRQKFPQQSHHSALEISSDSHSKSCTFAMKVGQRTTSVEKEYEVTVREETNAGRLKSLEPGIELEDGKTLPAKTIFINQHMFRIILKEGRKHQIRRMCQYLHLTITRLRRLRIGNIYLGNLAPGEFRTLTQTEVTKLKNGS